MVFKRDAYLKYKLIFWALLFFPGYYLVQYLQIWEKHSRLQNEGLRTVGRIYQVQERISYDDDGPIYHYRPKVYYATEDGTVWDRTLEEAQIPYKVGQDLDLLYFKEKPTIAKHYHYQILYADAVFFITIIIICVLTFGGAVYFFLRKFFMI